MPREDDLDDLYQLRHIESDHLYELETRLLNKQRAQEEALKKQHPSLANLPKPTQHPTPTPPQHPPQQPFKTRAKRGRGQHSKKALLTPFKVQLIRWERKHKGTYIRTLATRYGVSQSCVNGIVYYKNWRNLPDLPDDYKPPN